MKLARYEMGGASGAGVVVGDGAIASLSQVEQWLGRPPLTDGLAPVRDALVEWLWRHEHRPLGGLEAEVGEALDSGEVTVVALDEVRLLAPVHGPQKVIGTGNFLAHFEEIKRCTRFPAIAMLAGSTSSRIKSYLASPSSIAAPYDDLPYPGSTSELDYEVELAVVIRRSLKNADPAQAKAAILGVMVANDISARDIQMDEMAAGLVNHGKNLDCTLPLGPWIDTDWERCLSGEMRTRVNGQLRQQHPLADMNNPMEVLVSRLSADMTLHPGDVILGGTCPGPASFQPNWDELVLKPGDVLETEITTIGVLRNRIL